MKQESFFKYLNSADAKTYKGRTVHGGTQTKGHRKNARPLASKKWIHLILKSQRAKSNWSFLKPENKIYIERLLSLKSKQFGVKIDRWVNVGNHIHLKIKCSNRENFQKFLKSITCMIARSVTKARRGNPVGKFWQGLAFTRILKSALEELQLNAYFKGNEIEVLKGYQAREDFLRSFNQWVYRYRVKTAIT